MRLGLVLDQVVFEDRGRFTTDEPFIRFLDHLAKDRFERVAFCSRVSSDAHTAPYALDPGRFEIVRFPWYRDIPELLLRGPALLPKIAEVLSSSMASWDLVIAFGVHPITTLTLRMARRRGIPAVFWVRGDISVDLAHRLRGVRRFAGLAAARLCLAGMPAGTPVISMGRNDYPFLKRMGPVHVAFSSKIGEHEVLSAPRGFRPPSAGPRLLYVGRIAPEKGVEVMLEALDHLNLETGMQATLTAVGSDFHGSTYGGEFAQRVKASRSGGLVRLAGHVPFGPELLKLYDEHDILILPSYTEGFPQVIIEAMARGIPVIATRVGGVPGVVEDGRNGLLIPAGDAKALAAAVLRLVRDASLADALARRGLESVRPYTKERQIAAIHGFLDTLLPGPRV